MKAPLIKPPPEAGVISMLSWTSFNTQFPNTTNFLSATDIPAPTVIFLLKQQRKRKRKRKQTHNTKIKKKKKKKKAHSFGC
jgi:hypothetical protein